jgi:hypothetical protein
MSTPQGRRPAALVSLVLLVAPGAFGAQRTFVSTTGLDTNACSLTAPCRGFAKALTVTDPGGEVVVLDSGGYGAVAIGQPVSIVAPAGVYAGITVFPGGATAGQGIVVSSGTGRVTLRGLTINNQGGTNGIAYNSGDALYLDNVVVSGFGSGNGLVTATGAATANLFIQDSAFRDNATGIKTGTTTGTLTLNVERTVFERNAKGADLEGATKGAIHASTFSGGATGVTAGLAGGTSVKVELRDCTVNDNTGAGVAAITTSPTTLSVVSSLVSGNLVGIQAANGGNIVYVSDTTVTRNATGLSASGGGSIPSGGDNRVINNTANGAVSTTIPKI